MQRHSRKVTTMRNRKVTDLDQFLLEQIWRPYQTKKGYEDRLEAAPMGLDETLAELQAGGEWADLVLNRVRRCGFVFPPYVKHRLIDFIIGNDQTGVADPSSAAEQYVPGQWTCPKCKFTLQQMVMSAATGAVGASDKAGEKCPNCNGPLWRTTWKQDAMEMAERCEEQMARAAAAEARITALEAEVKRLRAALEPFACAWNTALDRMPTGTLAEYTELAKYHLPSGSFRTARAALQPMEGE